MQERGALGRDGAAATIVLLLLLVVGSAVAVVAGSRPDELPAPVPAAEAAEARTPLVPGTGPATTRRQDRPGGPSDERVAERRANLREAALKRQARLVEAAAADRPAVFRVASYNVLGAGHTAPGGNRRGWASGTTRIRWALEHLRSYDVSVAGLQEFQTPQATTFLAAAPTWTAFPGPAAGRSGVRNSIVWDTTTWSAIETRTTQVPYFGGSRLPMPHVLLEHRTTGQRIWFANYHNPADARGNAERWRDLATTEQIALFNQLRTQHPLVVTGDMNEREEYLCRAGREAALHAANGGYVDANGTCTYPRPLGVDWILGSDPVTFTDYARDESPLNRRTSDHPLHVTTATVGAAPAPRP